MAAKQKTYSFRFYGKQGFVPASRLRYATKFSIVYGGRTIMGATEFPKLFKKVADRRDFLKKLVEEIEKKRLKKLARRREQYRKRKIAEGQAQLKRRIRRQISTRKVNMAEYQGLVDGAREAELQVPMFSKAQELDSKIIRDGVYVEDAMTIPVRPDGMRYTKQIIDKTMDKDGRRYHLAIMDLTLDDDAQVPMTAENFNEAYKECLDLMLGSVVDYFEQTKNSSELYILRLKFLNRWDQDGEWTDHGISWERTYIRNMQQMINLFRKTFVQLFGSVNQYDTTKAKKLRTNYLSGDKTIIIKGLTLEATDL